MSNFTIDITMRTDTRWVFWDETLLFDQGLLRTNDFIVTPEYLEVLLRYEEIYVEFEDGDIEICRAQDVDYSIFVRWLLSYARYVDLESSLWLEGICWRPGEIIYSHGNDILVMELNGLHIRDVVFMSKTEWIYRNRDGWIPYCVQAQSGKEYAKSKWEDAIKSHKKLRDKCIWDIKRADTIPDWKRKAKVKRKLREKLRDVSKSYVPESGFDPKLIVEALEKLGSLYLVNYFDKPLYKACSALLLVFRGSVACSIYDILVTMCSESKPIEANLSDFVSWLKTMVVDVDKFKNNRFAKPFIRLICKLGTMFLCPDMKDKVGKIFDNDGLIGKVLNFFSEEFHPLESLLHLVTYVTNAVDVFIKTGELTGFVETQSLDDLLITELREMRDAFNLFKTGDIEFVKEYKIYDFVLRLKKLKDKLSTMRKSRKALDLKEIDNWIKEVDMMDREVVVHNIHHSAKMQGYYLSISSGSGISKGHLMNLVANTIAAANKIPHSPEYHYTLNQANKFQSGWSNATTIVKVDDAAAMMSTVEGVLCLADWLLRGSNNVPHELLGADISEKGNLFNRALIEVWTSNSFNMYFDEEARFPSALHRRFQNKIVATVRPEYTKTVTTTGGEVSSQIDYDKMPLEMRESLAPDAWLFTVYKCQIFDTPIQVKTNRGANVKERDNDYIFVIADWEGTKLEKVPINVLLEYLIDDSKKHFAQQLQVLKMSEKIYDAKNYCEHGRPIGMTCKHCKPKAVDTPKEAAKKLRDRVVCNRDYKDNHAKVFSSKRFEYFNTKDQSRYKFYDAGFDYVHRVRIPEYDKAKMYKAIVSYKCGVHKVTRVCDVDVIRTMPFADFLLPECYLVKEESGFLENKRVRYMKDVMEWVKHREINTEPLWNHADSIVKLLFKMRDSVRNTLQTWFDTAVLDVLMIFVDRVVEYVERVMIDPWKHVPAMLEGTAIGAYIHAKRPIVMAAAVVDWVEYKTEVCKQWLDNPYAVSSIEPAYRCTKSVYEKYLATPTRVQRHIYESTQSKSFSSFMFGSGMYISTEEKKRKATDPDLLRDTFVPALMACAAVTTFIPHFCKNFSSMYVEAEVGYMVSVEDIQRLDKEEAKNWYSAKTEIMKQEVTVDKTVKFTELENIVNKNTLYVRNLSTGMFTCGLSPKNQFIILPMHFAKENWDKQLEVVKVPHSTSPGNAKFDFCLVQRNTTELPGDLVLVYVEQLMDHMRTKDITMWFPLTPPKDTKSGRLLYKEADGSVKYRDAMAIEYHDSLNNENVMLSQPKNPFKGHRYTANTFSGLCGSPLIDHTHKKSCILGLHVGGRKVDSTGVSCFLARKDLEDAISKWNDKCIIQQAGVTLESYGIELFSFEIYPKNPVLDSVDRIDNVEVLGSTSKRVTRTSKVVYTPIYEDVKSEFKLKDDWGAPNFTFGGDKRYGARKLYKTLATKKALKHPKELQKAVIDYKSRIIEALDSNKEFWKNDLSVLSDHEIVNGKGVRYVSGMNMSTKFDAHLPGPKSEHAKQIDGVWHLNDYVWDEFHKREDMMKKGEITYELLVNALKNEATKKTAIEAGKIRNFFMCGTPFQMILRKWLQTTCRFFCLNTPYTECAVGINPHSEAWDKLFKEIAIFRLYLALDFVNFDLTSLREVLSEALDIIFLPRRHLHKVTQEELNIQKCIKHAILNAICDINGDITVLKGIIPSGINLTSILGCIVNSLNFRMAYYLLGLSTRRFHEVCTLRTFGDDSMGSSNDSRFSVSAILKAFDELGIQATDMHKNKNSKVKFYKLEDLEFLKRKGRYDSEFGCRVAPLVDSSRFKMLCCHVPTKHMSIEAVTGQCVDNFLLEATFHGRKVYEKEIKIIKKIVDKHGLQRFCQTLNLSFDDRLKQWKEKYQGGVLDTSQREKNSFSMVRLATSFLWNSKNWFEWTEEYNNKNNTCSSVSRAKDVEARPDKATNQDLSVLKKVELDELDFAGYVMESGVQKEEVLTFVETPDEETMRIGGTMPEIRSTSEDCSLQQFLARPVKIAEYAWGSALFAQEFDPWNLLLNNKRIANRISNYKLFRGTCHIKIIVNGNGFYYGKLMISYLPFEQQDYRSQFNPLVALNRIPMSQCPHVFLDATTSKSCTMVLPFFYPMDYVYLQDTNARRSLGSVGFYQIAGLRHANQDIATTLSNLTISVYAWFEDTDLAGPTHLNIQGISAQSGTEEESVDKPISQTCTAVASAMQQLSMVPYIGPYALAIEKGASLTATVASALGFSNPLDCVEPARLQPRMIGNTCVANTTDSAMKLSLDIKQDTTIDPSTVGLGSTDELAIQHIASRESFIETFDWNTSQTIGTLLYNFRVTPMMYTTVSPGVTNYISAICGATIPFSYWNGSIVFKFQVVCSANHKGRLAVVYDPNYSADGSTLESNVAYMEIVDISLNREFEVTLHNHQPEQWLRIPEGWYGLTFPPHSASRYTTFESGTNGTLSIYVLNELTSPASDPTVGNTITLASYIRAGKDYQVANPSGKMSVYQAYVPESGVSETMESGVNIDHVMVAQQKQMRVYQGERVESFRMLLKRYQNYMRVSRIDVVETAYNVWYVDHQGFPVMRGLTNNIPYTGANQVAFTYIQYLMGAFSGWKGSFRWKVILDLPETNFMIARRDTETLNAYASTTDLASSGVTKAREFATAGAEASTFGGVWTNTSVNPALEIELPFYSQYKFVAGKPYYITQGFLDAYTQQFRVMVQKPSDADTADHSLSLLASAGEDFTLYFFSGFPPIDCFTVA